MKSRFLIFAFLLGLIALSAKPLFAPVYGSGPVRSDTDLQEVQIRVGGITATRTNDDYWRPPPCPTDLNEVAFGGICMQTSTGKIRYRGVLEAIQ